MFIQSRYDCNLPVNIDLTHNFEFQNEGGGYWLYMNSAEDSCGEAWCYKTEYDREKEYKKILTILEHRDKLIQL